MRSSRVNVVIATLSVLAVAGVAGAGSAFAKSDVTLSASATRVTARHDVRLSATGDDDAAGRYSQICVQLLGKRGWHDLRCSKAQSDEDGPVSLTMRVTYPHATVAHLRARLYDVDRHGAHRVAESYSSTVNVRFVAA